MIHYRCSQCGKTYTSDEYRSLDRQPLYPEDEDPEQKGGYERVCAECGAGFHSDKWQLREAVAVNGGEFDVSTVALTIPHGLNHDQWYETCVFYIHGSAVVRRYETQEEAEAGHEEIVEALSNGEYHMEPVDYRLVMDE